jgi:transposase
LLRRLYGPRGERFDPSQPLLFAETAAGQDTATAVPTEPAATAQPKRRCRPHGRRRMPENLPREPRHHELSEAERACPACGQMRVDIGTDRSEQLDYRPASLYVVEHFVHKYACPCCSKQRAQAPWPEAQPVRESEPLPAPQPDPQPAPPPSSAKPAAGQPHTRPEPAGPGQPATDQDQRPQAPPPAYRPLDPGEVVIAAPKPAMPIAKGLPGPGLLAHLIVSKYTDHMPLHRLERAYERQGLFLHRSTLCDWLGACADLLAEVIRYVRANVRRKPPKKGQRARERRGGGGGTGKVGPLRGRHLEFLTGVVLGTEALPDDTVGCWAAPALRHLMLVDGLGADEALAKVEEFYGMIPDPSFSDRLSRGAVGELLRSDAYTASHIGEGNLYQPRPEESAEIFAGVKARCRRLGFVFADPSTWGVLARKGFNFDIAGVDFSLTFEEKLAVKEPGAALLKCDVPSVYQVAHLVKAYVTKYPGRELPASLVPALCGGLPINWFVPSDGGSRCKKAERFLGLLCDLGVIKKVRGKRWCGPGHPDNRAATYGLPQDEAACDLGRRWYYACLGLPAPQEGERGCKERPQYHDSG